MNEQHVPSKLWTLLTLLALPAHCPGQDASALGDAALQGWVERLVPVVERACGRKFVKPPVAVLADVGDVMRVLRVELQAETDTFYAGNKRSRIRRALQLRADMLSAGVMGKYAFDDGQVLLVPDRVALLLKAVGLGEGDEESVLQVVLLHELVHALQDQELQLGRRFAGLRTMPAVDALVMLTEGHAVLCSELAARELGLQRGIDGFRQILARGNEPPEEMGVTLEMRRLQHRSSLTYFESAALLERQYRVGGSERLWQLLDDGVTVLGLFRPEQPAASVRYVSGCFEGIEKQLAGASWTVGRGPLSALAVLCENYGEREAVLAVLADWRAGAEWRASSPTPVIWRAVDAMVFASEESAAKFVELAERWALRGLTQALGKACSSTDGPAIAGTESRRIVQTAAIGVGRPGAQITWFRRGACVVQATVCTKAVADAALVAAADAVLRKLAR